MNAAGPEFLCSIQGRIGALQQFVGIISIHRCHDDAHAGADLQRLAIMFVGLAEDIDDLMGQLACVLSVAQLGHDHAEFVAPDSRHRVGLPHAAAQPKRHHPQHIVTEMVPEGVIDLVEPIQVEDQDADWPAVSNRPGDGIVQAELKIGPVGDAGDVVRGCHLGEFRLAGGKPPGMPTIVQQESEVSRRPR